MAHLRGMRDKQKEGEVNFVHQDAIYAETCKKELKEQKLYTNFTINPHAPRYLITGKPNSAYDADQESGEADAMMKKVFREARKPPTERYAFPQTESQEYGWMSQPLIDKDLGDVRLFHPKRRQDITIFKETDWRLHKAKYSKDDEFSHPPPI